MTDTTTNTKTSAASKLPEMDAMTAQKNLIEKRKTFKIIKADSAPEAKSIAEIEPLDVVARLEQTSRQAREFNAMIAAAIAQVKQQTCGVHGRQMKPDLRRSIYESRAAGETKIVFEPCPVCHATTSGKDGWMLRAGIQMEFVGATLDNWKPRQNTKDAEHLNKVRQFSKKRVGFLIMLGEKGTGKTHLGVGLIVAFHSGLILSQNDFLRRVRKRYSDNRAEDIIERCQQATLLVIDELGLSSGGRDELPALHEVLQYRHSNYKPTALIGNIHPGELQDVIGERMIDRLRQSLAYQLIFEGESNRPARRGEYEGGASFQH